jgi:hypothetical protein
MRTQSLNGKKKRKKYTHTKSFYGKTNGKNVANDDMISTAKRKKKSAFMEKQKKKIQTKKLIVV